MAKAVAVLLFLVVVFWFTASASSYRCTSRWPSAMKPRWGFVTGCTILHKDIRIPESAYRAM